MTRKTQSNPTQSSVGTTSEGQTEPGQLTEAEVKTLTEETAGRLLALGGGEAQEWIEKGRIIDEYVARLQPNGKYSKPNPFTKLAEREDIPWGASQLRMYRDSYLLWQQVGGTEGASKVDPTTVGLVLSLDEQVAKKVLNRAVKENLTTRQVAALVKKAKGNGGKQKVERIAGDWKALGEAAERLDSELSLMLDCPPACATDCKVAERLEVVAKSIEDLLARVNTPGWGAK